jgi:hypothetical protein
VAYHGLLQLSAASGLPITLDDGSKAHVLPCQALVYEFAAPQLQGMFRQHILAFKVRKKAVRRFANSAERAKRLG